MSTAGFFNGFIYFLSVHAQAYLEDDCEGPMGSVYPSAVSVAGMNPFLAGYQYHQGRNSTAGYTLSPSAMFPSVSMQQYMSLQGLSPFNNPPHFNHSLLSAAQLQVAHLTNAALQQAATNENIKKTETSTKTQNDDKDDKSEPTKNLAHSIDRLLKKDETKKEEAKPDSDDHISSTSDSTESQTKSKLLVNAVKM